jgi:hypothetical protein
MGKTTTDILKTAFRKLLAYTYYDKTDMVMRHQVAMFAKSLFPEEEENRIFVDLLNVAEGKNDKLLEKWLDKMSLSFYPKKLSAVDEPIDDIEHGHVITNMPPNKMKVERLLIKANMPVELCILDVAWLLSYGTRVDGRLYKHSYGNRMDLTTDGGKVRSGNALFLKYQSQYKGWWENGVKAANKHIKEKEDVTIVNFDISNCYHSIDFNFDEFLVYYDTNWPEDNLREDALTQTIIKVYQRYWEITQNTDIDVFNRNNAGKHPLPLTLMSAHVLANWYLSPLDDFIIQKYKPYYYGRYVDDCMVVVNTKSTEKTLIDSIQKELPGLIDVNDSKVFFAFAVDEYQRLGSFELPQDKLYIYRFNCLLPQSSLDEFVQGQIERSSEFRFITDDADAGNVGLEFATLVNTLDVEEEPGRRFNILEENRYKLAVYLAKLASRLAKYGKEYKRYEEVEKVHDYFKDGLVIKHYQLWERLMTVFVLAGKKNYVEDFVENAKHQIEKLEPKEGLFGDNAEVGRLQLVKCLMFHLEQSKNMALSLYRETLEVDSLYLDTFMVRMHYNLLPLQEFYKDFATKGVKLTMDGFALREDLLEYRWMPYYVKYYAIVNALSIGDVYKPDVYKRAFAKYCALNHIGVDHSYDWMAFCRPPQEDGDSVTEFNVDLALEPKYDVNRTVSVVEMDIEDSKAVDVIDSFGMVDADKIAVFDNILDQITKIYKTDIFILPELSLPVYELMSYCLYAAKHERAFVSGMEYVVKNDVVYNYIITCLPITLYGQKDAIPVIRLKNHYAPDEIKHIGKKVKNVPQPTQKWQNLYHWHGHVFTSYYCFELANIKERSFFYSMIDAMYCPVFNKDTYYFNNIVESMARDMHCYFILCNVSHYGDSCVTKPDSHVTMNMLKVKGGNTIDNKAVVLSSTLDVEGLRDFQKKDMGEQEKSKKFKKTPPDYIASNVDKRKDQFMFEYKDKTDGFLADLAKNIMEY